MLLALVALLSLEFFLDVNLHQLLFDCYFGTEERIGRDQSDHVRRCLIHLWCWRESLALNGGVGWMYICHWFSQSPPALGEERWQHPQMAQVVQGHSLEMQGHQPFLQ